MYKLKQDKKVLNLSNGDISSDNDDNGNNDNISTDDDDDESDREFRKQNTEYGSTSARTSPVATHLIRRSCQSPNTNRSFNVSKNTSYSYKESQNPIEAVVPLKYKVLIICAICIIFSTIVLAFQVTDNEGTKEQQQTVVPKSNQVDKLITKSMQTIQSLFYKQKEYIWNDISAGIYDITLYPEKPVIIILFGNETNTVYCLAQVLAELGGKILGTNDYLRLTPKDFPNDVGETIYNLRKHILQKQAVIIQDLLSINPEGIKAFHNFCDKQHPLIGKAIYIFTVIVDKYQPFQREVEFIESYINKNLSGKIEKDILDPLVTRITDATIVSVLPETAINYKHTKCSFPIKHKL
ncbi:torsin interacting protein isoform X2 [Calliopsis andreniformis]